MRSFLTALLLTGALALSASCAPILYRIEFSGESAIGSPLPSGSFVYDPDVGFSDFLVNWNGVTLDLTSSANAPQLASDPATGCDLAASDPQYGFIIMTQSAAGCTSPAQYAWAGDFLGGSYARLLFTLNVVDGLAAPRDLIGGLVVSNVPLSPPMDFAAGGWTVTAVPEPSTLALGLASVLSLASIRLIRRCRRPRS